MTKVWASVVAVSSDVVVVVLWHVVLVVDDFDGWKKDKDEDGLEKAAATGRRLHARRRRMVFLACVYICQKWTPITRKE